jgi:hypothetical protein
MLLLLRGFALAVLTPEDPAALLLLSSPVPIDVLGDWRNGAPTDGSKVGLAGSLLTPLLREGNAPL